jgi:MFS family permease
MTGRNLSLSKKGVEARRSNPIIAILGIGVVLSLLGDNTLYTVLPDPEIAAQAGLSLTMVGVVLGINRLVRVVFNTLAGILYDRFPRRGLMVAAMGVAVLSTSLYALAEGVEILIVGRILWGLAWSGIWVGANTVALDRSEIGNRGRITGRLQMWFFMGAAVSALAGGLFTDLLGYRGGLWLSTALTSLALLLWLGFLPETRRDRPVQQTAVLSADRSISFPWKLTLSAALPYFALRFAIAGVISATTILWLSQFVGGGVSLAGFAVPLATLTGSFVAIRVVISMLSAPAAGSISDKLGRRWVVLTLALVFGGLGLWLMSFPTLIPALPGALFATISAGGIQSLVPATVGDWVESAQQSRALGLIFTVGDFGSALGPAIGLWLIGFVGMGGVYQMCALLFFIIGIFAAWQAAKERKAF